MSRWAKDGILKKVFDELQCSQIVHVQIEEVSLDSTIVKVHPDGTGALKKRGLNQSESLVADGPPKFIWLPPTAGQL